MQVLYREIFNHTAEKTAQKTTENETPVFSDKSI